MTALRLLSQSNAIPYSTILRPTKTSAEINLSAKIQSAVMEAIVTELLDMTLNKLKKFEGTVQINESVLGAARTVLVEAYDIHQKNPEFWAEQGESFVAEHYSENLHGLCLMFELTVLHAKALASIRLINAGFDPKADERICLLNNTLKFGGSFSDKIRLFSALTMATEPA